MLLEYWPQFFVFATAHTLSLISPGPDFLMVVRSSLRYTRATAIWVAFGISCAEMIHVSYTLLGIGWMLTQSVVAFTVLKYIGAAYLVFIGVMSLRTQPHVPRQPDESIANVVGLPSRIKAFGMGFLTNMLNVKAAFFTISFFTVLVEPNTPGIVLAIYATFIMASTFAWFCTVAVVLTHPRMQTHFLGARHWIERGCGALLIGLGLKIANSSL